MGSNLIEDRGLVAMARPTLIHFYTLLHHIELFYFFGGILSEVDILSCRKFIWEDFVRLPRDNTKLSENFTFCNSLNLTLCGRGTGERFEKYYSCPVSHEKPQVTPMASYVWLKKYIRLYVGGRNTQLRFSSFFITCILVYIMYISTNYIYTTRYNII